MIGRIFVAACALATGGVLALACGGTVEAGNGAPSDGTEGDASTASGCDAYFSAIMASVACSRGAFPSAEEQRLRARWDTECQSALTLPGTRTTNASLEACAATVLANPCAETSPAACETPPGTLPVGALCASDSQCASTSCSVDGSGGGSGNACGTCLATVAPGGACDPSVGSLECAADSYCIASNGGTTCTPMTFGGLGAACNEYDAVCGAGLYCDTESTSTCVAAGGAGAACDGQGECANGLACENGVCATAPAPTVGWAAPGATCNGSLPCITGACQMPDGSTTGLCPTIVADGQPCPSDESAACDFLSTCVAGICSFGPSTQCN